MSKEKTIKELAAELYECDYSRSEMKQQKFYELAKKLASRILHDE